MVLHIGLFDELKRPVLHRTDCAANVTHAGQDQDGKADAFCIQGLLRLVAVQPGRVQIKHDAPRIRGVRNVEKGLAAGKLFYSVAMCLEQQGGRLPNQLVIVDEINELGQLFRRPMRL